MLSDEEVVRFIIGDCFVHLDKDSAETRLSEFADEYKNDVKTLEKEIGGIKEQLQVGHAHGNSCVLGRQQVHHVEGVHFQLEITATHAWVQCKQSVAQGPQLKHLHMFCLCRSSRPCYTQSSRTLSTLKNRSNDAQRPQLTVQAGELNGPL